MASGPDGVTVASVTTCSSVFTVGFVGRVTSGSRTPPSVDGLARQWFRGSRLGGVRHDRCSSSESAAARTQFHSLGVGVHHEAVVHRDADCHDGNEHSLSVDSVTSQYAPSKHVCHVIQGK